MYMRCINSNIHCTAQLYRAASPPWVDLSWGWGRLDCRTVPVTGSSGVGTQDFLRGERARAGIFIYLKWLVGCEDCSSVLQRCKWRNLTEEENFYWVVSRSQGEGSAPRPLPWPLTGRLVSAAWRLAGPGGCRTAAARNTPLSGEEASWPPLTPPRGSATRGCAAAGVIFC